MSQNLKRHIYNTRLPRQPLRKLQISSNTYEKDLDSKAPPVLSNKSFHLQALNHVAVHHNSCKSIGRPSGSVPKNVAPIKAKASRVL